MLRQRRVVVTGLGLVSPLGCDLQVAWRRLLAGELGVRRLARAEEWAEKHALRISVAGTVPSAQEDELAGYDEQRSSEWMRPELARSASPFVRYALHASRSALRDAGVDPGSLSEAGRARFGVSVGSGMGGPDDLFEAGVRMLPPVAGERRQRPSPFALTRSLVNLAAGQVSIQNGLRGPNLAPSTACTAGAHSIGDACRAIQFNDADLMLAGGAEASVSPLGLGLFASMRALSSQSDPNLASRPFDSGRDGFVMGEGAAILVLEELEHARARGAHIYAEVCGYGLSADAHHVTAPDGSGARLCMRAALRSAGLAPWSVGYVNAHATSTPLGDDVECAAIEDVFGLNSEETGPARAVTDLEGGFRGLFGNAVDVEPPEDLLSKRVMVSSTKASTGHTLGGAGALEALLTIMSVKTGVVPPTTTLRNLEYAGLEGEALPAPDLGPHVLRPAGASRLLFPSQVGVSTPDLRYAISNSFGFGGTNASVIFGKFEE